MTWMLGCHAIWNSIHTTARLSDHEIKSQSKYMLKTDLIDLIQQNRNRKSYLLNKAVFVHFMMEWRENLTWHSLDKGSPTSIRSSHQNQKSDEISPRLLILREIVKQSLQASILHLSVHAQYPHQSLNVLSRDLLNWKLSFESYIKSWMLIGLTHADLCK